MWIKTTRQMQNTQHNVNVALGTFAPGVVSPYSHIGMRYGANECAEAQHNCEELEGHD